ncbi:hypothetical protein CEXT_342301 [Caerostris extrusa]|uniref:Uncharacterized protein n=1 Tax=Caerostris extrusa TaxID=172846 RepID=A0AAV4RXZ4_CAEEX|nr:hypothetical protein CEXT_342301 [Caerostris extrusa]
MLEFTLPPILVAIMPVQERHLSAKELDSENGRNKLCKMISALVEPETLVAVKIDIFTASLEFTRRILTFKVVFEMQERKYAWVLPAVNFHSFNKMLLLLLLQYSYFFPEVWSNFGRNYLRNETLRVIILKSNFPLPFEMES